MKQKTKNKITEWYSVDEYSCLEWNKSENIQRKTLETILRINMREKLIYFTLWNAYKESRLEFLVVPIIVSSYSMADAMGLDGELASQAILISTILSIVTIFSAVFLFNYFSLL